MIHTDILEQIKKDKEQRNFIYPYYEKYSIAEVPPTILSMFDIPTKRKKLPASFFEKFGSKKYKKILFFFVDGLGYNHFKEYLPQIPFFQKIAEKGEVFPLTSVFPSTTPAALTTIHTNLTPQEHGLPEWTVYFEEFDRIIETFPFRPIQTVPREILMTMGGHPDMLYKGNTIYQMLAEHNITSYLFTAYEYATSAYSATIQKGSIVIPCTDYTDMFAKLIKFLKQEQDPSYFFVYWSHIDSIEHVFGPKSPEHQTALASFSKNMFEKLLSQLSTEVADDVLFLMTADHGQAGIKGEDIIYLNKYLPLEENYMKSPNDKTIQPTGAPHDVFLFIHPDKVDETIRLLRRELQDKADVETTEQAVKAGLFGINQPSERFLKRIGNVLILPHEGYHVWYKHAPNMHYGQRGIHGGLSEEEMIVPFVIAKLKDLIK